VEVDEGVVEVTRLADGQTLRVPAGAYVLVGREIRPMSPLTAPITLTETRRVIEDEEEDIRALAFTPDGTRLATGGKAGALKLWETDTTRLDTVAAGHTDLVTRLAFSPDGRVLATGSRDKTVRFWDARTGEPRGAVLKLNVSASAISFCDGGQLLAAADHGPTGTFPIRLWRHETGQHEADLAHDRDVSSLAAPPDGSLLAAGSRDGIVSVWDASHRVRLTDFRAHEEIVHAVAFSPDGRWLATAGRDAAVRVWDTTAWRARWELKGHNIPVVSLAFCPDRMLLASVDNNGNIRLWDLRTGREVVVFRRPKWYEPDIAFSPDGRTVAVCGYRSYVFLWDVPEDVRQASALWRGD
jgi:WD40 repeat protein